MLKRATLATLMMCAFGSVTSGCEPPRCVGECLVTLRNAAKHPGTILTGSAASYCAAKPDDPLCNGAVFSR